MNETIEAIRYDLVRLMSDLICALDEDTALAALVAANERIEAALQEMEARPCSL